MHCARLKSRGRSLVSDLEAALAAHLNGKFFWEHTECLDEGSAPAEVVAIRQAQKRFSKGAKNITVRNRDFINAPPKISTITNLTGDQVMLEPLVKAICEVYGVTPKELMGQGRAYRITKARKHFYWAISRYFPSVSISQTGRLVGRDHSTIIHSRDAFEANYDFEMVGRIDELMGHK